MHAVSMQHACSLHATVCSLHAYGHVQAECRLHASIVGIRLYMHFVLRTVVRLAGSSIPNEGRLEVYHNRAWGTICDDFFNDVDATVACKSLGSGLVYYFLVARGLILVPVVSRVFQLVAFMRLTT